MILKVLLIIFILSPSCFAMSPQEYEELMNSIKVDCYNAVISVQDIPAWIEYINEHNLASENTCKSALHEFTVLFPEIKTLLKELFLLCTTECSEEEIKNLAIKAEIIAGFAEGLENYVVELSKGYEI